MERKIGTLLENGAFMEENQSELNERIASLE